MHTIKQSQYIEIYLAYLLYSLTNWITVALGWCGIAAKMQEELAERQKLEWSLPHTPFGRFPWSCSCSTCLYTVNGGNEKWWHLLTGFGNVRNSHVQTYTHTRSKVFAYDAIIKSENLWKSRTEKCKKYKMIIMPHRTSKFYPLKTTKDN